MNPVPSTINPATVTGRRMATLVLAPHHKPAQGGEVTHMTLTDVKSDL
jgi:hypothetical protein